MKALRQLITRSKKEDDLNEVAKYSKNYIPILLNLYVSDVTKDKAMKTTIYQTLAMFFSINDEQLNETIFGKAIENKDAEQDLRKKSLYLDILRCVVCNLKNEEKIVQAFEFGLRLSENKEDKLEQKKALRLLEELIKSSSNYKVISNYYAVKKNESFYENMITYYSKTYSFGIFAAQASFANIIQYILTEQFKEQKLSADEFYKFVPIIINILQFQKSAKLTASTFGLLNCCIGLMVNGANQAIGQLNELLGNCCVNRKATIIYILHNILIKYKEQIDNQTKASLITNLLSNLSIENNKVVNVILLFLNDWFKLTNKEEMLPYITNFISYLNSIENPCSPQFKYKIKNLIEKMLRKFGVEIVTKMLGAKYQNLIRVTLKKERRENKVGSSRKDSKGSADEFDDDEDVVDKEEAKEFRKNKSNKRWRFDEDEDFDGFHIFDTLANEKAVMKDSDEQASKSKKESNANKKVTFNQVIRIDKEGQLMEDEDEDQIKNTNPVASNSKVNRKNDEDSESSDNEEDLKSTKKKQQKLSVRDSIMNKYKRKRGIHRDLGKDATGNYNYYIN